MKNILIKDVLLDGKVTELYVSGGAFVSKEALSSEHEIIDASGLTILPSLVDIHTHLRDPGFTHKETILTGLSAAKAGGIGALICMPNTNPPCDNAEVIEYILTKAKKQSYTDVYPCACITKGQKGEELCDFEELKSAGATAFSDDGKSVPTAELMREALILAKKVSLPILSHAEDVSISKGGAVNDGEAAKKLGVRGIPNSAEDIITARDIILAGETNSHVHICHVSTKSSVQIIRTAKKYGINVTAESCPHYFALTEDALFTQGTNAKMNPPLRTEEDRLSIIEALCDGTLDCITTDHAPHSEEEKATGLKDAQMGISGLETSFSLSFTYLVKGGYMSLSHLLKLMHDNPLGIIGQKPSGLTIGSKAKFMFFDSENKFTVDKNSFWSMGKNTPFDKMELYGKIYQTE